MKPGFLAPPGTIDKKPPHGAPCNRCGLCCVAAICALGQKVFRRELGPCPALRYDQESNSSCGLVAEPMTFAPKVALEHGVSAASRAATFLIGTNTGCDARMNGEPINHDFYARLRQWDHENRSETRRAKRVWGFS